MLGFYEQFFQKSLIEHPIICRQEKVALLEIGSTGAGGRSLHSLTRVPLPTIKAVQFPSSELRLSVVRKLLKRMSKGVVLQRRLPKAFGGAPILVSPDSALAYWRRDLGSVDPYLLSMARELVRPGMMVWDIGANVGLFAFAAAALGADVLAVEPDAWLSSLIHRSSLLNRLSVTVLPAAVGDTLGIGKLYLSTQGRASNSMRGSGACQTTVTVTLDWLLEHFQPPSIVKIDIEGMEGAALRGASQVLQLKPTILCEVTREHTLVGNLLTAAGYKMYGARSSERNLLQTPYCETLAIADQ